MLQSNYLLLLSLLLTHLLLLHFFLFLDYLLFFSLDVSDSFVELGEEMRKFRIYLIDQVAEIGTSFVVHALEEHDGGKVFLEVLDSVFGKFSLENVQYFLFLAGLHFFS